MTAHIIIPRPQIHTGPKHQTVDEATIAYLTDAAKRVRTRQIWGSGVSALVADILDNAAAALLATPTPEAARYDDRVQFGVRGEVLAAPASDTAREDGVRLTVRLNDACAVHVHAMRERGMNATEMIRQAIALHKFVQDGGRLATPAPEAARYDDRVQFGVRGEVLAAPASETAREHLPLDVYEMPDESAEALLSRIEDGTAVLAMRVCSGCAPSHVVEAIEDGTLDLSDGDALDAQWPCSGAPAPTPPTTVQADRDATYQPCSHECNGCPACDPGLHSEDRDAGQVRLVEVIAAHQRMSRPGGDCWCGEWPNGDGQTTWPEHVAAAILAARQSDPDATERVVADLVRLIDYWETQAGVDRDMESKTLRGVVAHLKALVRRTVTTSAWEVAGDE